MIPRIDVETGAWPPPAIVRQLARRVRRAARAMGLDRAQLDALALSLVGDDRMRALKAEHFGLDEATDVLSFPAGDGLPSFGLPVDEGEGESEFEDEDEDDDDAAAQAPPREFASLGEIVINRDAVLRQAASPGAAGWLDEATALAIHGVAHLLGHDHDAHARARRMRTCERRGTRAVGLPFTRPY